MPKFPDRWFDYSNVGDVIEGTRIITFKVPLKEAFFSNNRRVPDKSRFTPATLVQEMQARGLNLGLVIDLTFTDRYYSPTDFTNDGIQYKKIFVPGHIIPDQEILDKFYQAVDDFKKTDSESLVGVHCTHGVNRTGYIVCRYMVEHLGMKATEALEAYKKARGYPVERQNYIHDLKKRAGEEYDEEALNSVEKSPKRGEKKQEEYTQKPDVQQYDVDRSEYGDNYQQYPDSDGHLMMGGHANFAHDYHPERIHNSRWSGSRKRHLNQYEQCDIPFKGSSWGDGAVGYDFSRNWRGIDSHHGMGEGHMQGLSWGHGATGYGYSDNWRGSASYQARGEGHSQYEWGQGCSPYAGGQGYFDPSCYGNGPKSHREERKRTFNDHRYDEDRNIKRRYTHANNYDNNTKVTSHIQVGVSSSQSEDGSQCDKRANKKQQSELRHKGKRHF